MDEVDKRLLSIQPPDVIDREGPKEHQGPQTLLERCSCKYIKMIAPFFTHCKTCILAQECRNFLLYYVPATLIGILPDQYFCHILLLVKGIRLLLGTNITPSDVEVADQLLKLFYKLYEEYYGKHMNGTIIVMHTCI